MWPCRSVRSALVSVRPVLRSALLVPNFSVPSLSERHWLTLAVPVISAADPASATWVLCSKPPRQRRPGALLKSLVSVRDGDCSKTRAEERFITRGGPSPRKTGLRGAVRHQNRTRGVSN